MFSSMKASQGYSLVLRTRMQSIKCKNTWNHVKKMFCLAAGNLFFWFWSLYFWSFCGSYWGKVHINKRNRKLKTTLIEYLCQYIWTFNVYNMKHFHSVKIKWRPYSSVIYWFEKTAFIEFSEEEFELQINKWSNSTVISVNQRQKSLIMDTVTFVCNLNDICLLIGGTV